MGWYNSNNPTPKLESSDFRYTQNNLDTNGKKQKEVYPTLISLCHAWASGNVIRGRSGCSMFFENGTIYSYGYHYQAAKIYTNKKGEKLVLINSKDYSSSTANHLSEIRSATSHLKNVGVPTIRDLDHDKNLEYLNERMITVLNNIFKMKGYTSLECFTESIDDINLYCNFFGIQKTIVLNEETLSLVKECIKVRGKKRDSRDAKRKITENLKEEKLKEENKALLTKMENDFPEYLSQWVDGELSSNDLFSHVSTVVRTKGPFGHEKRNYLSIDISKYKNTIEKTFKKRYLEDIEAFKDGHISANHIEDRLNLNGISIDLSSPYALLRVKENKVETSEGADVPLDHAIKLLKLILNKDAKKGDRVGLFTLETIKDDPKGDKTIIIGCHKILLSEAASVLKPFMNSNLKLVKEEV